MNLLQRLQTLEVDAIASTLWSLEMLESLRPVKGYTSVHCIKTWKRWTITASYHYDAIDGDNGYVLIAFDKDMVDHAQAERLLKRYLETFNVEGTKSPTSKDVIVN
jgi:hypothetical protein